MIFRLLFLCVGLIAGGATLSGAASAREDDENLTTTLMMVTGNFALGKTPDLPHYNLIKNAQLDLSWKSLETIDAYLLAVRADLQIVDGKADLTPLTSEDIGRLVYTVGAYVGEVIRVNVKSKYHWFERSEWLAIHPDLKMAMEDPTAFRFGAMAVLGSDDGFGMLPMEQVAAGLVLGPPDAVVDFAKGAVPANGK